MVCKKCGNDKFYASQILNATVVVDQNGDFFRNLDSGVESAIFEAERPVGPYICTRCGTEVSSLKKKIVTVCCRRKQEWNSREQAMKYFAEKIKQSTGAEKSNYVKVYTSLQQGYDYCTDDKRIDNKWM